MSKGLEVFEAIAHNFDDAQSILKLVIRFFRTFGEEDAKTILTRLLANPPKKADLSKLDEALAETLEKLRNDNADDA